MTMRIGAVEVPWVHGYMGADDDDNNTFEAVPAAWRSEGSTLPGPPPRCEARTCLTMRSFGSSPVLLMTVNAATASTAATHTGRHAFHSQVSALTRSNSLVCLAAICWTTHCLATTCWKGKHAQGSADSKRMGKAMTASLASFACTFHQPLLPCHAAMLPTHLQAQWWCAQQPAMCAEWPHHPQCSECPQTASIVTRPAPSCRRLWPATSLHPHPVRLVLMQLALHPSQRERQEGAPLQRPATSMTVRHRGTGA